jgi:hypothetical protein
MSEQTPEARLPARVARRPIELIPVNWPQKTEKGKPIKGSQINVLAAAYALKLDCRYDQFLGKYYVGGMELFGEGNEVSDRVVRAFRDYCFRRTGFEPIKDAVREGLMRACEAHTFNSVQDYLLACIWDGVPRVEMWLSRYLGVADTKLHRVCGDLVLRAACRRAFDPGCKWDQVLSLEGPEGTDKSTAVKVLAGAKDLEGRSEYFSDSTILDKQEKEQMELSRGVWFYELSEMSGASKADQKKLKAFVTRQEDRSREAYAYFKTNQPRSAVFIATVNTDPNTGDIVPYLNPGDRRRWWPVRVGTIDIEALMRDRDQLFAEAMQRAAECEDITNVPLRWNSLKLPREFWNLAEVEQVEREITDPLVDRLGTLYAELSADIGNATRMIDGHHVPAAGRDYLIERGEVWVASAFVVKLLPQTQTTDGRRVAAAMAKLGWRRVKDRRTGIEARGFVHKLEKQPGKSAEKVESSEFDVP